MKVLTYDGILMLVLAQGCSPWGRERVLLAMEDGGVLHDRAWVAVR